MHENPDSARGTEQRITDEGGTDKFGFTWQHARQAVARLRPQASPQDVADLVEALALELGIEPYQFAQIDNEATLRELEQRDGLNTGRASEWEHPPADRRPAEPEQREGRIARQDQPVIPGMSRLCHVEHPQQMYTIMRPVPASLPVPEDADAWIGAFGRGRVTGILPGGDGKTSAAVSWGTDSQGNAVVLTPLGGPGLDLCGTCHTPVGEPSPGCTETSNHRERQV
ncbi:hypothetical protein [Streptomyces sp. NPDC097619]|uniref:hypothetical protein n=1 Tax=Streptomyces sp. NPDC097619 TaxID=3157228 RepID=UPI003320A8A6